MLQLWTLSFYTGFCLDLQISSSQCVMCRIFIYTDMWSIGYIHICKHTDSCKRLNLYLVQQALIGSPHKSYMEVSLPLLFRSATSWESWTIATFITLLLCVRHGGTSVFQFAPHAHLRWSLYVESPSSLLLIRGLAGLT